MGYWWRLRGQLQGFPVRGSCQEDDLETIVRSVPIIWTMLPIQASKNRELVIGRVRSR